LSDADIERLRAKEQELKRGIESMGEEVLGQPVAVEDIQFDNERLAYTFTLRIQRDEELVRIPGTLTP
jgi:hypothetical protein